MKLPSRRQLILRICARFLPVRADALLQIIRTRSQRLRRTIDGIYS